MTIDTAPSTLLHARSKDGTDIAIERSGSGPTVILVSGASVDRHGNADIAAQLAPTFTVFSYDRRGRGDSGDTPPYAVEREVEDIDAVLQVAGGSAFIFGSSSGAALALEAATGLAGLEKVAMWEPPYQLDPDAPPPVDHVAVYERLLAEGKRSEMAEYFMGTVVGMPAEFVAHARTQPWWAGQVKIAPTLAYDARILRDESLPRERAKAVTVPVLVLTGGASFPFMPDTARRLVEILPNGRHEVLPGQRHDVAPEVIGPVLAEFFAG
jgi:pimeloyl-ACP methyl ester carboxylesterase